MVFHTCPSSATAYPILGVHTNIPFLIRVLEHPRFRAGDVDTGWLDREGAALAEAPDQMPVFLREALTHLGTQIGELLAKPKTSRS